MIGAGIGCGMTSMGIFISKLTTVENKAVGISIFKIGLAAGSTCGAVVGALLADRYGYRTTFAIIAAATPLVLVNFFLFKPRSGLDFAFKQGDGAKGKLSIAKVIQYLKTKNVYVLLASWSATSAVVFGFIYFFMPVYLNSLGFDLAHIGLVNLVFGLASICFMKAVAHLVDRARNPRKYILVAGVAGISGLAAFALIPGEIAILLSVLLLSITSMFSQTSYFACLMNSKETKEVGEGPAYSALSTCFSIGQTLGPLIIGSLVAIVGFKYGIGIGCLAYLIVVIFFAFVSRSAEADDSSQS
jgi:predicted MFS family arabinose efflux permease